MTSMRVLSLFVILFFTTALQAFDEHQVSVFSSETNSFSREKIYVDPWQIHINADGIFFLNSHGNLEALSGVFSDSHGIYFEELQAYQCPSCRRWNRDNICHNKKCPLYRILNLP